MKATEGAIPAKPGRPEFWGPDLCSSVSRRQDTKPEINLVPGSLMFSLFSLGYKWSVLMILLSYAHLSEWGEVFLGLPGPAPLFYLRSILVTYFTDL